MDRFVKWKLRVVPSIIVKRCEVPDQVDSNNRFQSVIAKNI